MEKIIVVGSGPSGVSAAFALVNKGYDVTMLDAGITLEDKNKKLVEKIRNAKNWSEKLLEPIKKPMHEKGKDAPLKYVYGSDYSYKDVNKHTPIELDNLACSTSLGLGGLSSVWGAALMPHLDEDISDWPIKIKDLKMHYEKVLGFMGMAANKGDDLEKIFPFYTDKAQPFKLSSQAKMFLQTLNNYKSKLNNDGIFFGSPRLAVRFESTKTSKGCVYCGLCFYGCPYNLIYNSEFTVQQLKKHKNFHYINNFVVNKIKELNDKVMLSVKNIKTRKESTFKCDRVFLACGVLPTARIMLNSMNEYNHELLIKDSQHFMLPCLRYEGAEDVTKEKLFTLSQLYIEIFDKKLDKNSIHMQVYTYNDLYDVEMEKKFGFLFRAFKAPFKAIMGRTIVIQGYVHSNSSPQMAAKLDKNSNALIVKKIEKKSVEILIKKITKNILKNKKYFRMIPLIPMLEISKTGGGNHYGATFPMRKNPKKFESDLLGRPFGYKRTHIVDASVLPSIPTQTITLTTMANAHKIATEFDEK